MVLALSAHAPTVLAEAQFIEALPQSAIKKEPLKAKLVRRLDQGDTLHPTFSPDGRYIAFTRVVIRNDTELAETGYLDLRTGKSVILLGADSTSKLSVYKAFVYNIRWLDTYRVEFSISDGDVDSTIVTFEIPSNKMVAQRASGADEEAMAKPEHLALAKQYAEVFPEIRDYLPDMFRQAVNVAPGRWVFQKNYANQDDHVWLVDAKANTHRVLVKLPEEGWHYGLRHAISRGNDLVLVLAREGSVYLVLVDSKLARIVDRFPVENYQSVYAVQAGNTQNRYFTVHTDHVRTRQPARLYRWDKRGVQRMETGKEIIEADVSKDGKLAALVSWQGDKRVVEVLRLGDR